MSKIQSKWTEAGSVWVDTKIENSGSFSVLDKTVHIVAAGQGGLVATLPSASPGLNAFIKVMTGNIVTDSLSIAPVGGALIDGVAGSYSMTSEKQCVHLVSDGTDWYIL